MVIIFNDSPQVPNRSVGAYRIASALRAHGVRVEVIDFFHHWERVIPRSTLIRYVNRIKFTPIDWVGFSSKFTLPKQRLRENQTGAAKSTYNTGVLSLASQEFENQLLQHFKSKNIPIVVGGPSVDLAKYYYTHESIDIVCQGYADSAVIAIHEHIINKAPLIYTDLNGMKFVDADKDYKDIDLGNIPVTYTDRDFIEKDDVFAIEISRGCIFHCHFCSFAHLGKRPGTYIRPKESIKAEIVDRYNKYGSTKFMFVDDTFNDSVEKMKLIKEIRDETKIPFEFWSYARLDLLRAKPEMVDLIDQIGWKSFTFGVETFNRASGSSVGKGADPEKLKEFLIYLRERFPTHTFFVNIILGLPEDTLESIQETVDWFKAHPNIPTSVRIRELDIHDKRYKGNNSKIALNPENYGYDVIIPIDIFTGNGIVDWKNKNKLSRKQLHHLSDRYQTEINEAFGIRVVTSATNMKDVDIIEWDDEKGMFINREYYKVQNYIKSKCDSRNLDVEFRTKTSKT